MDLKKKVVEKDRWAGTGPIFAPPDDLCYTKRQNSLRMHTQQAVGNALK